MFLLQVIMVKYVQLQVFGNLSMLIRIVYLLTFHWLLGFQNRIEFATWCLNFQSFNTPFFVYLYLITKSKLLFSKSFLQIILCFNDIYVYVSICGFMIESADATGKGQWIPRNWNYWLWEAPLPGCWELSSARLQVQYTLLTSAASLQPHLFQRIVAGVRLHRCIPQN